MIAMASSAQISGTSWSDTAHAVLFYESVVVYLAGRGWTASQVWVAATGLDGPLPDCITASQILAITTVGLAVADGTLSPTMGHCPETLGAGATWLSGSRTLSGSEADELLPGLNIVHWSAGFDGHTPRRFYADQLPARAPTT